MNRFYFLLYRLWFGLVVFPTFRLTFWLIQSVFGSKAAGRFGAWWTT
jgi:hypothetical protein